MPLNVGGMAAYTSADVTLSSVQARLAGGKNVVASATLTLSSTGLLKGIAGLQWSASITLTGAASVAAKGRLIGTTSGVLFTTAGLLQGVGGLVGSALLSLTGTASGALVSALQGSASFTLTVSAPTLRGAVSIAGATSFSMALSVPDLGAPGRLVGATSVQLSGAALIYATGHLEGHITPFTELSPNGLAAAVWSALQNESNPEQSMGRALLELLKIHGLVPGVPLVVTDTSRTAGPSIEQTIEDVSGVVTVERT